MTLVWNALNAVISSSAIRADPYLVMILSDKKHCLSVVSLSKKIRDTLFLKTGLHPTYDTCFMRKQDAKYLETKGLLTPKANIQKTRNLFLRFCDKLPKMAKNQVSPFAIRERIVSLSSN